MKVIITKSFEKNYLKKLYKYFSKEELIKNLKEKEHNFISLHDPFLKVKSNINLVNFRGVVAIMNAEKIIPLFIFLKKDKRFGENISWENNEKLIEDEFHKNTIDIENGNFEIY